MLVPSWLYAGAFYSCLAVVFVTLLYCLCRPKTPVRSAVCWIPFACLVPPLLGALELNRVSHDVVRVRETDGTLQATRLVRLGDPSYPLAPGTRRGERGLVDTWVVNDSTRMVRIETVSYGRPMFDSSEPTQIPPGTAAATYKIDYVGPSDPPPNRIHVEGIDAELRSSTREWLTWGP